MKFMANKIQALFVTLAICGTTSAWADHRYTVCYHNQTNSAIYYINDGISHKWKTRGEFVGSGEIKANTDKCFGGIADETMFSTDYITFTLGKEAEDGSGTTYTRWGGIVHPAFSKSYVIAQNATATKGGKLTDNTSSGKDTYELHVFVTPGNKIIYSNSSDFKDTSQYIEPRFFK